MKTLEYYRQGDPEYARAAEFSERIYFERFGCHRTDFPEFLFVISENDKIFGTIGLNRDIHEPLFTRDASVMAYIGAKPEMHIGEQCMLAVEGYSPALPLLIAVFSEYAHSIGIDGILFAGIDVSMRTITGHLGLSLDIIGPADSNVLTDDEFPVYEKWFVQYSPIICVLSTTQTCVASVELLEKFKSKVHLGANLSEKLRLAREVRSSTKSL